LRLYEQTISDLVNDNFGHVYVRQAGSNSLDSFGNLEVTPSLAEYPFGRIYYGVRNTAYSTGHVGDEMSANVVNFLQGSKYQPPVTIPTNWLQVGHVDEFLSFVPNLNAGRREKKYKLLIASPRVATRLCRRLPASVRNTTIICRNKGAGYALAVRDFLDPHSRIRQFNARLQDRLDEMLTNIICPEFKLANPDDIIHIPAIFNGDLGPGTLVENAIARTGGMVNSLVVKPNVIIPKPFGPQNAAGEDIFEKDTREKLQRLGLTVHFVDDWLTYHVNQGEIHCGTNTKRRPPADWEWWRRETQIGGSRVHR
jgi:protein-arginine deiminase